MALIGEKGNHCIPPLFAGWVDFKDPDGPASRLERRRSAPIGGLALTHRHGLFGEVVEAINEKKLKVKPSENEKWKYFAQSQKAKSLIQYSPAD